MKFHTVLISVLALFPAAFMNAGDFGSDATGDFGECAFAGFGSDAPGGFGGCAFRGLGLDAPGGVVKCAADGGADSLRAVIVSSAERLSALDCDFIQTRVSPLLEDKAVSTGRMTYRRPGFLQWEYISPFSMKFTSDGKTVTLERDGKVQPAGSGQNRIVREMARMIVSNIEGRVLLDGSMFDTEVSRRGDEISVVLRPKNKDMKKMWSSLVLTYDSRTLTAKSFEMFEVSGDVTAITFSNARYEFNE